MRRFRILLVALAAGGLLMAPGASQAKGGKTRLIRGLVASVKVGWARATMPKSVAYRSKRSVNRLVRSIARFNSAYDSLQRYGQAAKGNPKAEKRYRELGRKLARTASWTLSKPSGRPAVEPGQSILAKHAGLINAARANRAKLAKIPPEPGIKSNTTHKKFDFTLAPEGIPQDKIAKVTYILHPSFRNPVRVARKAPFTIKDSAYGSFPARAFVEMKDGSKQRFDVEVK